MAILFQSRPSLGAIERALGGFPIVNRWQSSDDWVFRGPGFTVAFRPEVNGFLSVDVVGRPWPDSMGDPKTASTLFGAWALGHFGPFAYPGNLERAAQQAWHWPEARDTATRHGAFVRVRSSYVFGVGKDAPVLPPDYEPLPELLEVTGVARALLDVEGALAYFSPNGECLCRKDHLDHALALHAAGGAMPQNVWANVRLVRIEGHAPWVVMDTVGMSQLDVLDQEACCDGDAYDLSAVAGFLRDAADYVFEHGEVVKNGDTMDGPGNLRWHGVTFEAGLIPQPPRRVLRWLPMDGRVRPTGIQGEAPAD